MELRLLITDLKIGRLSWITAWRNPMSSENGSETWDIRGTQPREALKKLQRALESFEDGASAINLILWLKKLNF